MIEVLVDIDLKEFIPRYLQNKYDDIEKIHILIQEKDFAGLRKIGHNFQGTGTSYGFEFVSLSGKRLRQAAIDEDLKELKKILKELEEYFKDLKIRFVEID